jgi:hypothetical protein
MVVLEEWLFGQFDVGKVLFVQLDEVIVSIGSTKLSPLKIVLIHHPVLTQAKCQGFVMA